VALWAEPVVVREMVALLRRGRIAPLAASTVEGVPVAAPCPMSEVAKVVTPRRRIINMSGSVEISGGREETSHASSVF